MRREGEERGDGVRLYAPGDAGALAALHARAFDEPAFGLTYWSQDRAAAPNLCVVAERDGVILAYCDGFLAGGGGDVNSVATREEARGQGWGRRALRGFLTEAARRGAAVIHLEVAETNEAARALYAACGFAPVGRRARYYADGADALVLAVSLDAAAPDR